MSEMNPEVDDYLAEGCGRCSLAGKPECKVHTWSGELVALRRLALAAGLKEERKWGMPCYTWQGKNVVLISAFKQYAALNFIKGVLLSDPDGLLESAGENSQSAKQARFTHVQQIKENETQLLDLLRQAVAVQERGQKVDFRQKHELVLPDELLAAFDQDPVLQAAFHALTPGRQRGYVLHFNGAKQSATRSSRIERCRDRIIDGIGLNER